MYIYICVCAVDTTRNWRSCSDQATTTKHSSLFSFFFFWFLKVKKRSKDDAEPNRDTQKRTTLRIVTGMKKMGARIDFKKKTENRVNVKEHTDKTYVFFSFCSIGGKKSILLFSTLVLFFCLFSLRFPNLKTRYMRKKRVVERH